MVGPDRNPPVGGRWAPLRPCRGRGVLHPGPALVVLTAVFLLI